MSKLDKDDHPLPTLKSKIEQHEDIQNHLLEEDDNSPPRNKKFKTSGVNMFFSAVYLVFLLLTLLFSSIALFSKGSARLLNPTLSTESLASKDSRRMYTLFNGLKVAFITANETMPSAISLVIQAGIGDEEYKGIAKLTQMIFEYKLKRNPIFVSSSSSITHERTHYTTEMDDSNILKALEYMSSLLMHSSIEIEDIKRAVRRLEYENRYNVIESNPEFIEHELLYHYFHDNGDNDQSQFKEPILAIDFERTLEETHKYIETLYYANRMSIAIVNSNRNIKKQALDILSILRISDRCADEDEEEEEIDDISKTENRLLDKGDYSSQIYWYKSKHNSISVYFLNQTFDQQFFNYFKYTLDTYGEFYLFEETEDFIKSIEAFSKKISSTHEAFGLRVELTIKGFEKLNKVIKGLLSFVYRLSSDLEKELGLPVGFTEIKQITQQKIIFNTKTSSSAELASDFANRMFIKEEGKEALKNDFRQLLRVIIIGHDKYPSDSFYVCGYFQHSADIQSELNIKIDDLNNQIIGKEIVNPKVNEGNNYISKYKSNDDYRNAIKANSTLFKASHSGGIIVLHKDLNVDYRLPKTLVVLELTPNFNSNNNHDNDKEKNHFSMLCFESYLTSNIKKQLSEAVAAGNDIEIKDLNYKSIRLSIFGYNDKMGKIVQVVFDLLSNWQVNSNAAELTHLNETVWDSIRQQRQRRLYSKAEDYFYYLIGERDVDIHRMRHSLFNVTSISDSISQLALNKRMLTEIKGIVHGQDQNFERELPKIFNKDQASSGPLSLSKPQIGESTSVNITRITNLNREQNSHLVSIYALFGKGTRKSDSIMTWLLEEFIRERLNEIGLIYYEDSIAIKRTLVNDNIWLNFAMESFNATTNAIQLNIKLNEIIVRLRAEIRNRTLLTEELIGKYKLRYDIKNFTEHHSIATQTEKKLNSLDGIGIRRGSTETIITADVLFDLFSERLFTNPYLLSIQLFPFNFLIPDDSTTEKYQLNETISSRIQVM